MKKKSKGFDPLDEVIGLGAISSGTLLVGSLPGLIDSPISGRVGSVMSRTLPLLPMTYGVGSVFRGMGSLVDIERKIKKNRR